MGPKLYRVPIFYGSDFRHSKLARASNYLAVGSIEFFVGPDQQLRIRAPSKNTRLDRAPTFYSNHILWFACSTNESWALHLFFATVLTPSDAPVDEYRLTSLTLRQRAQKQLRIQSSLSFNGGAGCKVLDHLHLCCVSLRLYIPPPDVTKHSMQLPSTYEPLHCAAPVPVYACLSLCVDIVFWFSFCIFFLHVLRKPAGQAGLVTVCEHSEGVWGDPSTNGSKITELDGV